MYLMLWVERRCRKSPPRKCASPRRAAITKTQSPSSIRWSITKLWTRHAQSSVPITSIWSRSRRCWLQLHPSIRTRVPAIRSRLIRRLRVWNLPLRAWSPRRRSPAFPSCRSSTITRCWPGRYSRRSRKTSSSWSRIWTSYRNLRLVHSHLRSPVLGRFIVLSCYVRNPTR